MGKPQMISLLLAVIVFGLLEGCSAIARPRPQTVVPQKTDVPATASSELDLANDPALQTLYQFADLTSRGEIEAAVSLVAPGLKEIYEAANYAPIRNTPQMEILKVIDRTGVLRADIGATDPKKVKQTRVFYLEVRYKVLGIIRSYFKDGEIYYHKGTVLQLDTGEWLISELSGTAPLK